MGDGGRDWGDVATSQGHWSAQKLREAGGSSAPPHRSLKDARAQNQLGVGSAM